MSYGYSRRSLSWSLATTILLAGGSWLGTAAIAPEIAQAYTGRYSVYLVREPGERYETLIRRAETTARAIAQRGFDSDILVTEVQVTVIGQNDELMAPLLTLQVSRDQWRSRPDTQAWATYYRTTRALLQLEEAPGSIGQPLPTATSPTDPSATSPAAIPPGAAPAAATPPTTTTPEAIAPGSIPPQIVIPATPPGQVGLPQSILQ